MKLEYNISTRKKNKGHQVIVSYKENGKWKQKSKQGFKSSREARLYGNELVDGIRERENLGTPVELKDITLKEFIDIYIEDRSHHLAKNSIDVYKYSFKKLEPLYNMKVQDISYFHLNPIFNNLKKTSSNKTYKNYLAYIKILFNNAVRPYRLISENPTNDIPDGEITLNTLNVLSKNDIPLLLNKMKSEKAHYYIITAIAAYTGLRRGEILGLTWNDIDLKKGTLEVNKQWGLKQDGSWGFKKTKTVNSNRIIYFPTVLKNILKSYKKEVPIHTSKKIVYQVNSIANISTRLSIRFEKYGYEITLHDLRHSYATIMLSEGTDIKTVAALLGDTVETVMKTYIHYSDDMREKAKIQIENIF